MNEQLNVLDRAMEGDKDAFDELIKSYTPFLKSIGRCYFTSYFDIEDAIQEVWIKVYKYLYTINDKQKFKSWLTSVMRCECLSSRKREKKRISRNIPLDIEIKA